MTVAIIAQNALIRESSAVVVFAAILAFEGLFALSTVVVLAAVFPAMTRGILAVVKAASTILAAAPLRPLVVLVGLTTLSLAAFVI